MEYLSAREIWIMSSDKNNFATFCSFAVVLFFFVLFFVGCSSWVVDIQTDWRSVRRYTYLVNKLLKTWLRYFWQVNHDEKREMTNQDEREKQENRSDEIKKLVPPSERGMAPSLTNTFVRALFAVNFYPARALRLYASQSAMFSRWLYKIFSMWNRTGSRSGEWKSTKRTQPVWIRKVAQLFPVGNFSYYTTLSWQIAIARAKKCTENMKNVHS